MRLMSVCENTVPAITASSCLVGPWSRRATTTTRVGSPTRPGKTAEAMTPIIVARRTVFQGIGVRGSAARRICCQETKRRTIESAINKSASAIQPGLALTSACPMRCRFSRETANTSTPATRRTPRSRPAYLHLGRSRRRGGLCGVPVRLIRAGSIRVPRPPEHRGQVGQRSIVVGHEELDLSAVDLKPRLPEILSSSDDARAVALDLATGEALSDHEVHERAW